MSKLKKLQNKFGTLEIFTTVTVASDKGEWEFRRTFKDEEDYPKLRVIGFNGGGKRWARDLNKPDRPVPKYVMKHFPKFG